MTHPLRLILLSAALLLGCQGAPNLLKTEDQTTIDRKLIEYPSNAELKPYITGLTAPTAIAFDSDGSLLIAEGGVGGHRPRIFGFKKDGTFFEVYPRGRQLPLALTSLIKEEFSFRGPIGGMVV